MLSYQNTKVLLLKISSFRSNINYILNSDLLHNVYVYIYKTF